MELLYLYEQFIDVPNTEVAAERRKIGSLEFGKMAEVQRTETAYSDALHLQPDDRHGGLPRLRGAAPAC